MTGSPATLVPPVRLGRLLHEVRVAHGETVDDLVRRCGLAYDDDFFVDVEAGRVALDDGLVRWLSSLYDVRADQLVPARSQLVIDVDEGWVAIGPHRGAAPQTAEGPDDVLKRYLALVYELRGLAVGSPLRLRDLDLDVLGHALELRTRDVQRRLHDLMQGDREPVDSVARRLRKNVVVPLAGVLVAVTAVGGLLFVRADDDRPASPTTVVDVSRAGAVVPGSVDIGTAAVEVNPAATGSVVIGEPIVVERGPGGEEIVRVRKG